jgi:hypothetical protein
MANDSILMTGNLTIKVIDSKNGELKDQREVKNLVVGSGKNYIARRMTSNANVIMSHMAVGNINTAPVSTQTVLEGEVGRVVLDSTSLVGNTITFVATFPAGTATATLREAGIFNDGSANTGEMLCRTNFNDVNKANDDIVAITWNVTVN